MQGNRRTQPPKPQLSPSIAAWVIFTPQTEMRTLWHPACAVCGEPDVPTPQRRRGAGGVSAERLEM